MSALRTIVSTLFLVLLAGCVNPNTSDIPTSTMSPLSVLSEYKSMLGVNFGQRIGGAHAGIDIAGKRNQPIIAAAEGEISKIMDNSGCGYGVAIKHYYLNPKSNFVIYTIYCHMSKTAELKWGDRVDRGDIIGYVGTSGDAYGVPHVHMEVSHDGWSHSDGDNSRTENPARYFSGCFDSKKSYLATRLTFPLRC